MAGNAHRNDRKPMLWLIGRVMILLRLMSAVPARKIACPGNDALGNCATHLRPKPVSIFAGPFASVLSCSIGMFRALLWRFTPLPEPLQPRTANILFGAVLRHLRNSMRRIAILFLGSRETCSTSGRLRPLSLYGHSTRFAIWTTPLLAVFVIFVQRLLGATFATYFSFHELII